MNIQYPDLTEILVSAYQFSVCKIPFPAKDPCMYYSWRKAIPVPKPTTEFAFGVASPGQNYDELLEADGYKNLACALNWYPSHIGEKRILKFWWKKYPENIEPQIPQVRRYGGNVRNEAWRIPGSGMTNYYKYTGVLAGTGCGFAFMDFPIPFKRSERIPMRYFTLLRAPLKLHRVQETWMKCWRFKKIDEGRLASYWLNGFDPKGYKPADEIEYWKQRAAEASARIEGKVTEDQLVG
jgi:hypothetical protein